MKSTELADRFEHWLGSRPEVFAAPGRVNLIGEHTDYNDGFVMPCAIGFSTRVGVSPRPDRKLVIRSEDFPGHFEFDVDRLPAHGSGIWADYVLGVAVMLRELGQNLPGANLLISGEVPIGAGLSSSAAIEVASAMALMSLSGADLPLVEIARLCQRVENVFIGAQVGIMDQFVSCLGRAGHALLLDCRSLEFKLISIPENVRLVICNTMVKHEHASGAYNRRREECNEGVQILRTWYPDIRALRDVSLAQLEEHTADLSSTVFQRCQHVIAENRRTLEGAEYLATGDVTRFGSLMLESHASLRDLYQVSCRELDLMVEIAQSLEGFRGGRMTGGGFGGCTVNLVRDTDASSFAAQIADRYRTATGVTPDVYICFAADGAGSVNED